MHYYKRNIGDYYKKAGRLSILQHGVYTLLTDACYDREQFPTLKEAIEWTWASTKDESEAVEFVLARFFEFENGVYIQKSIESDIKEFHSISEKNKQIAVDRETKRRENGTNRARTVHEPCTTRSQDVHEPPPNHKPLTINQEPLTINQEPINTYSAEAESADGAEMFQKPKFNFARRLIELGADKEKVSAWLSVRKMKKATNTDVALDGFLREVQFANITINDALRICAENSWSGFKASWMQNLSLQTTNKPTRKNGDLSPDGTHVYFNGKWVRK